MDGVLTDRCGEDALSEYEGILTGLVLDHEGDAAVGARISVEWFRHVLTTSEISDNGVFLACGLPRDRPVDVTVEWKGIEAPTVQVHLFASQRVTHRDITIPEGW